MAVTPSEVAMHAMEQRAAKKGSAFFSGGGKVRFATADELPEVHRQFRYFNATAIALEAPGKEVVSPAAPACMPRAHHSGTWAFHSKNTGDLEKKLRTDSPRHCLFWVGTSCGRCGFERSRLL
jgi:hypothetical protein